MKTLILSTLLCLFISTELIPQWIQQNSGTTKRLLSCFFLDANIGWAAGDQGTILKTYDGGNNWFSQSIPSDYNIHSIVFTDSLSGFAVSYKFVGSDRYSQIIKTTNGGANWSVINQYQDFVLTSINFADSGNGIAVGSDGVILITTDKGNTWYFNGPLFAAWYTSTFSKSKNLFWIGGNTYGYLLRTTDLGSRWSYIAIPIEAPINSIQFTDFFNGWACSESGIVIKSINSGLDWEVLNLTASVALNDLYFCDKDIGWVIGSAGKIFYTPNSGSSWNNQSSYTNDFYCIHMYDSLTGWVVGSGGIILKTTNGGGGATNVEDQSLELNNFYLYQNYPNPFNPTTKISWQSPVSGWQTIKLYDLMGREIETISDGYFEAGTHSSLYIVNSSLPSGVYYYRLTVGSYSATKKMVYIK
ncbi:YCF48-related protein [Ignavibacterium album]|uniref:YCF48-related protein n=1 Tax=Ignavibacterium album TaxID=591197 RepID=UPI0026F0658C|nr:YCF48-related protein [Ignavibacterium album]